MYINAIGHYLPQNIISNDFFTPKNGLTHDWIFSRTGIETRRRVSEDENTNTMAIKAAENALINAPYEIQSVDLIVSGTYTPYDLVVSPAHAVQQHFNIADAQVIGISTACSSFLNSLEIVEGYFATGKAQRALIVVSEQNSAYCNDTDKNSGHLWGDGAGAVLISKNKYVSTEKKIRHVTTRGLAHVGRGVDGVVNRPNDNGIAMPYGKDVFIHACKYMTKAICDIIEKSDKLLSDIDYIIPHQANIRIINHVAKELQFNDNQIITNINRLGNTGCASTVIGMSENMAKFTQDSTIVITVFGGGYSSGAALIQ